MWHLVILVTLMIGAENSDDHGTFGGVEETTYSASFKSEEGCSRFKHELSEQPVVGKTILSKDVLVIEDCTFHP